MLGAKVVMMFQIELALPRSFFPLHEYSDIQMLSAPRAPA